MHKHGRQAIAAVSVLASNRRDQRIVLICVFAITALAWLYLALAPNGMNGAVSEPRSAAWNWLDVAIVLAMWAIMMVGMMLPSASPMIVMFARINQRQPNNPRPFLPVWNFAAGYIVVWSGFSVAATVAQFYFKSVGLISPMMASNSDVFGAVVLISAGIYQWTPLKHACLRHCQTPLGFLMTRWRDGPIGAFQMGIAHGAYCVGCCWVLMVLLFVGGVMNIVWIAALAILIFMEKLAPPGPSPPRFIGTVLITWGGWVLAAG